MSFSSPARQIAAALVALAAAVLASIPTYGADLKQTPKIAPGLPASSTPSGAEAVGKLLNPQQTDPSIPLPSPNLSTRTETDQPVQKPQIYGRGEQGGQNGSVLEGLVGVRIPFPAAPASRSANTTSGGDDLSGGSAVRDR